MPISVASPSVCLPSWCTLTPTQSRWYRRVTHSQPVEGATLTVMYPWADKLMCTVDRTHVVHIFDQQDMKLDLETLACVHNSRGKLTAAQAGSFPFPFNEVKSAT